MKTNREKYAELLVRTGINIQKDQILVINSPIDCAEFTRLVTVKAYEAGAKEVLVRWSDEISSKIRYQMANDEIFDKVNSWDLDFFNTTVDKDAAYLKISASDPELMKDVNPKILSRQNKAQSTAMEYYRSRLMSNENVWCVASIPTEAWAKKVFPDAGEGAVDKLWDSILLSVRADKDDPVSEWKKHQKNLNTKLDFLNNHSFKMLKYKNSLGTDLTVELPKNHVWFGGGAQTLKGHAFVPNLPTEEVFTMPKLDGANGTIVSSMPLNYNGNLIENFSFILKDGLVIEHTAEKGFDILTELLNTDEGARRLGEVALVPYDSPISNQKILFYNTLFDENASCHFALGKAYPICIKDGGKMSLEKLKSEGANDSLVHVDFMVGTEDLEILGVKANGSEVVVFKNGNFIS